MKKFTKRFFLVLLIIIVILIIFLLNLRQNPVRSVYLVPDNVLLMIQTEEISRSADNINQSNIYKFLKTNKNIIDVSDNFRKFDSLFYKNRKLIRLFGSRQLTISMHVMGKRQYDYLYILDLKKASNLLLFKKYLNAFVGNNYRVTSRTYKNYDILELYDKTDKSTLYFSFVNNLMVTTYNPVLLEQSIDQFEKPVIGRDVHFIEIKESVPDKGVLNVFLNYAQIRKIFTFPNDPFLKDILNRMFYTGMTFDLTDDYFQLEGTTNFNDTLFTFFHVMKESGEAPVTTPRIIPRETVYFISVGFNSFSSFYQNALKKLKESPESYAEYESAKKKTEKLLEMDVIQNVSEWIDNEIAFVQTRTGNFSSDPEYSLILKAKNKKIAKIKLDELAKQVRKSTPVKFKAINYKGYTIHYLSLKGFFRLLFGKLFATLDKPYYAILDDYVVFSNHPQVLKNFIDRYNNGETLENSAGYYHFTKHFNKKSHLFMYAHTPYVIRNFTEKSTFPSYSTIKNNERYILSFPRVGMQVNSSGNLFQMKLIAEFNEKYTLETSPLDKILPGKQIQSPANIYETDPFPIVGEEKDKPEEALQETDSSRIFDIIPLIINDLDAKKQEKFWENGNLKVRVELKGGIFHGEYEAYYPSGTLKLHGKFRNGEKTGTWKAYNEKGNLLDKKRYK